ncbi:MAG: serine/threonine protein kinase [Sandarakinorhabdus sp.]|nr:serine/threonine protein kinase [Sandarakinorhabdus sp.]
MSEDPNAPKRTVFMRPGDRMPQPPTPSQQVTIPDVAAPAEPDMPFEPSFDPPPPSGVPTGTQRFGMAGLLVGATLNDNYEVTRYITQGGMGEIYEGRQIRGNVKVAIKVILPQFAADPEFYTLLEREADLLATLGHDAIVKFRGLSHDPKSQLDYLTLEYVHGPSLEDQMDIGPVDAQLCRFLLRRLASGLDAAHDKGVYHRDLSPDNILLRDGKIERATIIDFGIAKDSDTSKKTVIGAGFGGKLGFAAPEAFGLFGREIGPWTDIYSLALVVAAAARARVIDMGTATPIDAIQARQKVPELEGVEPWLASVLARMLAPDPADRIRSMSDVIAAVDALPAIGTPFDPDLVLTAAPAFVRAREATIPPGPFGGLGETRETTDLRLVRAGATTAFIPAAPKSKMPLFIGGGVVLALAAGAAFMFSGGSKPVDPAAASGEVAAVAPAPETGGAPDWAAARAALAAIPCSDIRAAAPSPGATTLAVTGWMAGGTSLPATAGNYQLDTAALKPITPAPDAQSCAIIGRLKAAAGDGGSQGSLKVASQTLWNFQQLARADGHFMVPNPLGSASKPLFLVYISDGEMDVTKRAVSGQIPPHTAAFPYLSSQPTRSLQFFLSAPTLPDNGAETGSGTAISRACAGGCESTSGWVVLE